MDVTAGNPDDAPRYEIRIKGHLEPRWGGWFDGLRLTHENDGTTVMRGSVTDQAALHGLLNKLRDAGLPLVSLTQVDPDHQPEISTSSLDGSPRRSPA